MKPQPLIEEFVGDKEIGLLDSSERFIELDQSLGRGQFQDTDRTQVFESELGRHFPTSPVVDQQGRVKFLGQA